MALTGLSLFTSATISPASPCVASRLTLRGGHSGEPPLRISGSPSLKDLRKVASEQGVTTRPSLGDLRKLAKEQNRGMPENVLRTVKTEVTGISVGNVERSATVNKKLLLGISLSFFAGIHLKSATLASVLGFATLLDALSDFICNGLLQLPFHDPQPPSRGHSMDPAKLCPYWPATTCAGPAACGLRPENIEVDKTWGSTYPCTLRGWLFRPTGAEDKKTLIIMSHGACRDRRAWLRHTPFLLKAGYTCLSFDYSDHGTSDMTDGITAARGTTLGLRESRDVARVVRYVREHFTAYDLVLMGTSTGSVSSFIALATDEFVRDHTKCLVAECPFASIAAITWDSVMNVVCLGMLCKNNRLVFLAAWPVFFVVTSLVVVKTCLRLAGEGYFTTISCAQAARTCTTPTLLLHGMQDSIVPSKHSESIAEGAECIKDVWFLPGAGHCQVWDTDPHEFERRTLSFLAQFCD